MAAVTATGPDLAPHEALEVRLRSLLLAGNGDGAGVDVAAVTDWFGAMQAQDADGVLWSLGVRLPGTPRTDVEAALEQRRTLRTWAMRGTVHVVGARDARWLVDLLGGRSLAASAGRRASLGLDGATTDRAVGVLGEALADGRRLTRTALLRTLADAGIATDGQRGYHLLRYAAQRGTIAMAPDVAGEQTFVLLDGWAPDAVRLRGDDALAALAARYVRSHGPVTVRDLARWSGLTMADARRGIAAAGDAVVPVRVAGSPAYADARALDPPALDAPGATGTMLLPGFDEYLVGFDDRSLMATPEGLRAVVPGGNGVFRPMVVVDGRVAGTWRRRTLDRAVVVEVVPLGPMDRDAVAVAAAAYGRFLALPVDLRWPGP